VKNFLARSRSAGGGKRARQASVSSGGDPAETDFQVLEVWPRGLLIEARPLTGRTHQIRVHLSEDGLPILGDTFYGARADGAPRVMLHAASLTFPHPVHKSEVSIRSPLPEDFLQCQQNLQEPREA
jgi:23S rRNA-/tRNA-specific pseudouridylate synthase